MLMSSIKQLQRTSFKKPACCCGKSLISFNREQTFPTAKVAFEEGGITYVHSSSNVAKAKYAKLGDAAKFGANGPMVAMHDRTRQILRDNVGPHGNSFDLESWRSDLGEYIIERFDNAEEIIKAWPDGSTLWDELN